MIANRVYANRMKNGDENSGDGFRFRGRGLIQLTGRDNYTRFAEALDMSIEDTVRYLETPNGAVASAGWFWDNNKLIQPRRQGLHRHKQPANSIWVDMFPTELSENEAVKKAWDGYRFMLHMTENIDTEALETFK
jgi:hypothetical protein